MLLTHVLDLSEDGGDVCIKRAKGLKDSASHSQSSVPGLAEAE